MSVFVTRGSDKVYQSRKEIAFGLTLRNKGRSSVVGYEILESTFYLLLQVNRFLIVTVDEGQTEVGNVMAFLSLRRAMTSYHFPFLFSCSV